MADTPFATGLTIAATARGPLFSDAGVTPAVDGGTVRQLNGLFGGNLSQATAGSRMTYRATGLAAGPCLEADGADWMAGPAVTINRRACMIAAAVYIPSYPGTQIVFGGPGNFNLYVDATGAWFVYDGTQIRALTGAFTRPGLNLLVLRSTPAGLSMAINGFSPANEYGQVLAGPACAAGTLTGAFAIGADAVGVNPVGAGVKFARFALYADTPALSDADAEAAMTWLRYAEQPPELDAFAKLAVLAGNSFTFGIGAGGVAASTYPGQVQSLLGGTWQVAAQGWPSIRTPAMGLNPYFGLVSRCLSAPRGRTVLVPRELSNDLAAGVPGAVAVARMMALCDAYRLAAGNNLTGIVLPDCETRGDVNQTQRANANAILSADFPVPTSSPYVFARAPGAGGVRYADFLVKLSAVPHLADHADATYFLPDQIHKTPAGQADEAAAIAPGITLAAGLPTVDTRPVNGAPPPTPGGGSREAWGAGFLKRTARPNPFPTIRPSRGRR